MTVPRPELTGDYYIDPKHSRLGFVARHATITKVRGSFKKFEGGCTTDASHRSSGYVRIDAASIDTGSSVRDEHLRSNDFLLTWRIPHRLSHIRRKSQSGKSGSR